MLIIFLSLGAVGRMQDVVKKLQMFYALYKQATVGPCTSEKPSKWSYLNTFNYLRDAKKWYDSSLGH